VWRWSACDAGDSRTVVADRETVVSPEQPVTPPQPAGHRSGAPSRLDRRGPVAAAATYLHGSYHATREH